MRLPACQRQWRPKSSSCRTATGLGSWRLGACRQFLTGLMVPWWKVHQLEWDPDRSGHWCCGGEPFCQSCDDKPNHESHGRPQVCHMDIGGADTDWCQDTGHQQHEWLRRPGAIRSLKLEVHEANHQSEEPWRRVALHDHDCRWWPQEQWQSPQWWSTSLSHEACLSEAGCWGHGMLCSEIHMARTASWA